MLTSKKILTKISCLLITFCSAFLLSLSVFAESKSESCQMLTVQRGLRNVDLGKWIGPLLSIIFVFAILIVTLIILFVKLKQRDNKIQRLLLLEQEVDEIKNRRAIADGLYDMVLEGDISNDIILGKSSAQIASILGLSTDDSYTDIIDEIADKMVREDFLAVFKEAFDRNNILQRFAAGGTEYTIELMLRPEMHNYRWDRMNICAYQSNATNAIRIVVYAKNIQSEKEKELKLVEEASNDYLTGLYNKRSAEELIDRTIKQSEAGSIHALILIDIDHFKKFNDTLGHDIGDEVIKAISRIIKSCFREQDIVCRMGGDEFLIFMKDCQSEEIVLAKAEAIINRVKETYNQQELQLAPSISIGIALYPSNSDNYTDLFTLADAALYDVKKHGRNNYRIFDNAETLQFAMHNDQRKLQKLILASADGVAKYALNRGFKIFSCTDRILSIMKVDKSEFPMEADTAPYVHPDDRDALFEAWSDAYDNHRDSIFTSTYRIQKTDGTYFKVKVNGFFVDEIYTDPETHEEYPMFYLIFTDVSAV